MTERRAATILLLFLAVVLLAVLSEPADAGTTWQSTPSGDYVHYRPSEETHPAANTWENIVFDAGVGQAACWQQIRYGQFGTPPVLNAYVQFRYAGGNCSWGGADLTYLDGWGYVRHLVNGSNQRCVWTPQGVTALYCAQQPDGSFWIQRAESRSSQPLQATITVCQHSGISDYCKHKTISIAF